MDTKHTPGPWKVDDAEDLPLAVIQDTETGDGICEIGIKESRKNDEDEERFANARLIAASPDLLDALKRTRAGTITWGEVDAAIAKAQGE